MKKGSSKTVSKVMAQNKEEEKARTAKANEHDQKVEEEQKELMKKSEKVGFFKRLAPYNKPTLFVFIALLFSLI